VTKTILQKSRNPLAGLVLLASLAAASAMLPAYAAEKAAGDAAKARELSLANKPWKGDFDAMLKRRMIRVLVPYSRSLYFIDRGRERGLTADHVRDFERYLNQKYAKQLGKRPLTIYIVATTRDRLFTDVAEGLGDIAAGNLTETEERLRLVDFVTPEKDGKVVRELVVSGPISPPLAVVEDLADKTVHVRPSSSYHESLVALNKQLVAAGKPPAKIVPLADELEDEDVMELLNAGLIWFAVVDDWKAKMWAQVLPRIKPRDDLVLRTEGSTGWAVRKNSPKLDEEVLAFHRDFVVKQGILNWRYAQYHRQIKQISNNAGGTELKRFQQTIVLFEKYGAKYGFDPLMLAAQGYQESQLNQEARSHVGAIGIMQIMPATGRDLGVGNIHETEPNIHGGAKYMDQLMTRFFPDANFSAEVRPLFAFASYNAGPGNIARMRKEAEKRGLNPDKWFNNVEIVVSERIGLETTTYVRNIYKYYTAYKLTLEAQEARRVALEKLKK
jgi:membrane-bound lytic murein transglycosylase MltF